MGNSLAGYERRVQRISSVEKENPFLDGANHGRKKRSLILNSGTWKRIVESTRRRNSKLKINPSISCPQRHLESKQLNDHRTDSYLKKSQSCYLINTGSMTPDEKKKTAEINSQPKNGHVKTVVGGTKPPENKRENTNIKLSNNLNPNSTREDIWRRQDKDRSQRVAPNSSVLNPKKDPLILSKHDASQMRANLTSKQIATNVPKHPPTAADKSNNGAPRKVVIQASTSELLRCLGEFICSRCYRISVLDPNDIISWLRGVDRSLLMQGWQDISFIMPSSVVFIYMLCREMVNENLNSVFEVQATVLTCLYMSYSYMGNEISYPLRPFLIEPERHVFWSRCCKIMETLSGKMLRINKDAQFFTSVFRELKSHGSAPAQRPSFASHRSRILNSDPSPMQVAKTAIQNASNELD